MRLYKLFSLTCTVIFAVVGFVFLFYPNAVLIFFNSLSRHWGWAPSPVQGASFYLTLAAAYMYLVTVLAFQMYRHPEENIYPSLLAQGKLASSLFSIFLFLTEQHYLVYFANFVIDGCIGLASLCFLKVKR